MMQKYDAKLLDILASDLLAEMKIRPPLHVSLNNSVTRPY